MCVGLGCWGRTQKPLLAVLELEVLVLELLTVDALATGAIALREVSALAHEVLDHAVECGAFVAKALLASRQGTEVLRSLYHSSTSGRSGCNCSLPLAQSCHTDPSRYAQFPRRHAGCRRRPCG